MQRNKLGSGIGFGHRTLRIEQLEQRNLLAGNVIVDVDAAGNLIITGDNKDNGVLVQNTAPGEYVIIGFDFNDTTLSGFQGGPTTISGDGDVTDPGPGTSARIVEGVTANIIINLKKGNDVLGVGNSIDDLLSLADECGFGFGFASGSQAPGALQVSGDNFVVPLSLIIDTSDGNDSVAVTADVGLSAVINTGKGDDNVAFGRADVAEVDDPVVGFLAAGSLVIVTNNGNDTVCAHHFVVFGAVAVDTGNNNDIVDLMEFDAAAVSINMGNGNDGDFGNNRRTVFDAEIFVDLNRNFEMDDNEPGGPLVVVAGAGNDLVDVDAVFAASIVVDTGAGNDGAETGEFFLPIEIDNCTVSGNVVLNTGPGNDIAEVLNELEELEEGDGFIGGSLIVNTGAGNDDLTLGGEDDTTLDVHGSVVVTLGAGNDELFVETASIGLSLTIDAGSGNDFVSIFNSTIGLVTTITMGTGNDVLDFFDNDFTTLIADGGPGQDTFNNDLDVDSNGNFDDNHIIVTNFEFFNVA